MIGIQNTLGKRLSTATWRERHVRDNKVDVGKVNMWRNNEPSRVGSNAQKRVYTVKKSVAEERQDRVAKPGDEMK